MPAPRPEPAWPPCPCSHPQVFEDIMFTRAARGNLASYYNYCSWGQATFNRQNSAFLPFSSTTVHITLPCRSECSPPSPHGLAPLVAHGGSTDLAAAMTPQCRELA